MRQVFDALLKELQSGRAAVLATIIKSSGSTPRKEGSKMLVKADGSICGTVGGGAVEYQTTLAAGETLKEKVSCKKEFTLTRNQAADIGMVCGGNIEIYLQYILPEELSLELCRRLLSALEQDETCWLLFDMTDGSHWNMQITKEEPRPEAYEGLDIYIEPFVQSGCVYIFGGGHVAQELVPVLAHLDFRCIVIDDREEFACSENFPDAEKTIVADLTDIGSHIRMRHCDYVCIMTRGHQYDYYIQKEALRAKPYYIGIMGSRNKIRIVTEKLMEDGFLREEIEACHMPIGTDIKAETPAEIAISIAGELIAARVAQRKGVFNAFLSNQASSEAIR